MATKKIPIDQASAAELRKYATEVLGMADRILVLHDGRITGEIANGPGVTQEQVMQLAVA